MTLRFHWSSSVNKSWWQINGNCFSKEKEANKPNFGLCPGISDKITLIDAEGENWESQVKRRYSHLEAGQIWYEWGASEFFGRSVCFLSSATKKRKSRATRECIFQWVKWAASRIGCTLALPGQPLLFKAPLSAFWSLRKTEKKKIRRLVCANIFEIAPLRKVQSFTWQKVLN